MKLSKQAEAALLAAGAVVTPLPVVVPPAAGVAGEAHRPAPPARTPVRVIVGPVLVRIASEANARGKLREKIARKGEVKAAVRAALPRLAEPLALPVVVRLTRVGGKELDDDNLARSLKAVRDVVAEWLGVDDADRRVRWQTRQRAGWRQGVIVDVRQREPKP